MTLVIDQQRDLSEPTIELILTIKKRLNTSNSRECLGIVEAATELSDVDMYDVLDDGDGSDDPVSNSLSCKG